MAGYRGAAVRKFLHVLLSQQYGSCAFQLVDHGRVFGGHAISKHSAGTSSLDTSCVEQVLQSDRNTMQRSAPLPALNLRLRFARLGQSKFRCHSYEGVELRIELFN